LKFCIESFVSKLQQYIKRYKLIGISPARHPSSHTIIENSGIHVVVVPKSEMITFAWNTKARKARDFAPCHSHNTTRHFQQMLWKPNFLPLSCLIISSPLDVSVQK